jgi:hypothetical protein
MSALRVATAMRGFQYCSCRYTDLALAAKRLKARELAERLKNRVCLPGACPP